MKAFNTELPDAKDAKVTRKEDKKESQLVAPAFNAWGIDPNYQKNSFEFLFRVFRVIFASFASGNFFLPRLEVQKL
jgi:hypothetical protein